MTTAMIEHLTQIQDKVVDRVESFQDPVVDTVRKAVDSLEERVPELPTEKMTERLPSARELIDNQYDFAVRMLEVSHEFVLAVLTAAEPVTAKVVKPAPAKTTTKKSGSSGKAAA